MSFPSPFPNKNSTQKRDLPMNLADVRNAALRERHRVDPTTNMVVRNEKCSRPSVLLVEKKLKSLSNPQVTNRFIVVIVINHAHEIIGKYLKEAFLVHTLGRLFYFRSS